MDCALYVGVRGGTAPYCDETGAMPAPVLTPLPTTGADIRAWRKRLGLTQHQAGALLGCSGVAICRMETGVSPVWPTQQILCWLLEDREIRDRVVMLLGVRGAVYATPRSE